MNLESILPKVDWLTKGMEKYWVGTTGSVSKSVFRIRKKNHVKRKVKYSDMVGKIILSFDRN